jgi:hypothetical protein
VSENAFPSHVHHVHGDVQQEVLQGGISKREWYATFAMGALLLRATMGRNTPLEISQQAFYIASAMEQQSKLEQ